jgi:hypothetical protein
MTDPSDDADEPVRPPQRGPRSDWVRAAVTATLVSVPAAMLVGLGMFWWSGGFVGDQNPKPAASGPVTVDLRTGADPTGPTEPTGPSEPAGPKAGPSTEAVCRALLAALPDTLGDHRSRPVAPAAAVERAAAWGDPAIVLRCGVGAPATVTNSAAQTLGVDGVVWLIDDDSEQTVLRATGLSVAVDVRLPAPHNVGRPGTVLRPLAGAIRESVPTAR